MRRAGGCMYGDRETSQYHQRLGLQSSTMTPPIHFRVLSDAWAELKKSSIVDGNRYVISLWFIKVTV